MTDELESVSVAVARAGAVSAADRARLAEAWRDGEGVLLETCHRVERYSVALDPEPAHVHGAMTAGVHTLHGQAAVRHAVEVAVGLDSVVVAEDQVLSQLRAAVSAARDGTVLDPRISRLMDLALRTGRRARSWLPAKRPTLADLALDRNGMDLSGSSRVLVIGAGRMGELAARATTARGADVAIASRTSSHAAHLAARLGVAPATADPGAAIAAYAAVILALAGPWTPSEETLGALASADTIVIDLSAPPAVPGALASALGPRLSSIDDLASLTRSTDDDRLVARLQRLTDRAVEEYAAWATGQGRRDTQREVAERSERIRELELEALWRRVPALPADQRAHIEAMTERLAARLLQEPLARLGREPDDAQLRVVRELFGL